MCILHQSWHVLKLFQKPKAKQLHMMTIYIYQGHGTTIGCALCQSEILPILDYNAHAHMQHVQYYSIFCSSNLKYGVRINSVAVGHTTANIHISVMTEESNITDYLVVSDKNDKKNSGKDSFAYVSSNSGVRCAYCITSLHLSAPAPFQDKTVGSTPQPLPNHAGFPPTSSGDVPSS